MTAPDATLVVDVVDSRLLTAESASGVVVLVDPFYGAVAVAAALDAGWGSVEVAVEEAQAPPIPLVSFEQPPPATVGGGRCRVRSDDLAAAGLAGAWLGAPAFARPLAARLAGTDADRVSFVPILAGGDVAADSWWAAGMLVRVLLDELDRPSRLTDAAGIAVTLAQGAEDAHSQLATGARWEQHLARGGHPDDARIAAAVDSLAIVPVLTLEDGVLVARPA